MNQTFMISAAMAWSAKIYHGIVPVEPDGSVFFEAPSGRALYFQLLDQDYRLVRGMRTFIQAVPGTTRSCAGCHEYNPLASGVAHFSNRKPRALTDESWGGGYLDYASRVQPILDAKCVSCHGEKRKEKMPDLRKGDYAADKFLFYTSFYSLSSRVSYYTSAYRGNWRDMGVQRDAFVQPYTEPGKFGAYASPLYALLAKGHHDVKLTDEERARLVLFMESNAAYFGHDENVRAQADGAVVPPVLQ
jgi:hypothetical protein